MKNNSYNKKKKKKKNTKKEDMQSLPKHKNLKRMKIDSNKNMIEGNYNIENLANRNVLLRKKLLEEYCLNNTPNTLKIIHIKSWNLKDSLELLSKTIYLLVSHHGYINKLLVNFILEKNIVHQQITLSVKQKKIL